MKRKTLFFSVMMSMAVLTAGANQPGYIFPEDANLVGSAVVYNYNEMNQYKIRAKIGYITDIMLKPGEALQEIVAGDTERWQVSSANVAGVYHVYIKPLKADITTNLIILSDARSYRLIVTSSNVYDDIVIFDKVPASAKEKAAAEAAAAKAKVQRAKDTVEYHKQSKDIMNTRYEFIKIKNVSRSMLPMIVYNTSTKTYISMSSENNQDLPVLYKQDLNGKLNLVNYRIRNGFMVIDSVMPKIYLAYGENAYAILENKPFIETERISKEKANHLLNKPYFIEKIKLEKEKELKKAIEKNTNKPKTEDLPVVTITRLPDGNNNNNNVRTIITESMEDSMNINIDHPALDIPTDELKEEEKKTKQEKTEFKSLKERIAERTAELEKEQAKRGDKS